MHETNQKIKLLEMLYRPYINCMACPLGKLGRAQVVFGRGNPDAKLVLIGEGPGEQEDLQGKPFVGRSGKLLSRVLDALFIDENDIFISNIVKCRPPGNRKPTDIESKTCKDLLLIKQLEIIKPRIICTLGSSAIEGLLEKSCKITQMRGKAINWLNYTIVPTYHPAYVLRNPKAISDFMHDVEHAQSLTEKS